MYHSLFTTYNNGTSCKKRTCSYRSAQSDNWFNNNNNNNNTLWNQKTIYYKSDLNEGWKVNISRSHWSLSSFILLVHFSAQLDELVRDRYHKSGVTMKNRLYIWNGNDCYIQTCFSNSGGSLLRIEDSMMAKSSSSASLSSVLLLRRLSHRLPPVFTAFCVWSLDYCIWLPAHETGTQIMRSSGNVFNKINESLSYYL